MFDESLTTSLRRALSVLADCLDCPFALVDASGALLEDWQLPAMSDRAADLGHITAWAPVADHPPLSFLEEKDGKRRLFVRLHTDAGEVGFVQSGDLPATSLLTRKSRDNESEATARHLIAAVCQSVTEVSRQSCRQFDNQDAENIGRIAVSIRSRAEATLPAGKRSRFSLDSLPALPAEFLFDKDSRSSGEHTLPEVMSQFAGAAGCSFTLLSLAGDLLSTAGSGAQDWTPDTSEATTILLEAALLARTPGGHSGTWTQHGNCDSARVVTPVLVDGLIVAALVAYMFPPKSVSDHCPPSDLQRTEDGNMSANAARAEALATGLGSLISLLYDRHRAARDETLLFEALVRLRMDSIDVILSEACHAVQRILGVTECSAFSLQQDRVVLRATTASQLFVCGSDRPLTADAALGKVSYSVGEGLTGLAAVSNKLIYLMSAHQDARWSGRVRELPVDVQAMIAPLVNDSTGICYGVLRAVKPASHTTIPARHQRLFAFCASQVAAAIASYELTRSSLEGFRETAEHLQDLVAEASHELRSPLHNILSLAESYPIVPVNRQEAIARSLRDEVYRAKRLVDNYLARGVQGRGQRKYHFIKTCVADILAGCVSRFVGQAERRGVTIRTGHEVDGLPFVMGDRDGLEQVFSNLLDNACKYCFEQTEIRISGSTRSTNVIVSIADFGLGIPAYAQSTIFTGYQRAVEDQTRFKPGTGLGLMIAKEIIERHKGHITVESAPLFNDPRRLSRNEGFLTTFRVTLPRA